MVHTDVIMLDTSEPATEAPTPSATPTIGSPSVVSFSDDEADVSPQRSLDPTETFDELRQVLRQWKACQGLSGDRKLSDHKTNNDASTLWARAEALNLQLPVSRQHPVLTPRVVDILTSPWPYAPLACGEKASDRGIGYVTEEELAADMMPQVIEYSEWSRHGWQLHRQNGLSEAESEYKHRANFHRLMWSAKSNSSTAHDFDALLQMERQTVRRCLSEAIKSIEATNDAFEERQEASLRRIHAYADRLGLSWEPTPENLEYMSQEYVGRAKTMTRAQSRPAPTAEEREIGSRQPAREHRGEKRKVSNSCEPSQLVDRALWVA